MSGITTHVLDVVLGKPAAGVAARLEKREDAGWMLVRESATDTDGRCHDLAQGTTPGLYRITFGTGAYLALRGRSSIYPEITVTFTYSGDAHYHLPLLLSDNSYTTYRGS
ncbi:MAG: hydroxyisourate hydrolase [Terracidiphilus sp.]|jgi:5-hydroxyisourate hydrolase